MVYHGREGVAWSHCACSQETELNTDAFLIQPLAYGIMTGTFRVKRLWKCPYRLPQRFVSDLLKDLLVSLTFCSFPQFPIVMVKF